MRVLLVAAAFAAVAVTSVALAGALAPQQIVDQRIDDMKKMGGAIKGASEAATPAEARAKLADAINFAQTIPTRFPAGTGPGDAGVTKTRSVPEIWTKAGEFKTASDALVTALKAYDAAIGSGDKAASDAALNGVREACKGCHKAFRGPE
jgi:cytochrome c556